MLGTTTDITDRKQSEFALARREVLDHSVELEFDSDQIAQIILEQSEGELEFTLDGVVSESDEAQILYGTLRGRTAKEFETILEAIPTIGETRLLSTSGDSTRYELTAKAGSIATVFDELDGKLQSLSIEDGSFKVFGEFPETVDPEAVTQAVRETYPDIELVSQRRVVIPAYLRRLVEEDLTDRQQTVLGMAYYANYFEQPRKSTGDELADQLGITRQTFNTHLRKAQSKVFHAVFEEAVELPTD